MFTTLFGKKKITDDDLSHVFINAVLELISVGFPAVIEELNEAPEFDRSPGIAANDMAPFAMLVLAGNLMEVPKHLPPGPDRRLASLTTSKLAHHEGLSAVELEDRVRKIASLIKRINQPSKNTVYGMSKALFHQYDLFQYQEAYFRDLKAPNPILLKRLNSLMEFLLIDWQELQDQYRIN